MIAFTVPLPPVPWKRPENRRGGGRYDAQVADKQAIRVYALEAMKGRDILDEAIVLDLTFAFKRPGSVPKRRSHPHTKPDLDNCAKTCLDAFEGVLYTNDSRVVELHARKVWDPAGVGFTKVVVTTKSEGNHE